MKIRAKLVAVMVGVLAFTAVAVAAGPQVSPKLAKTLKAAQDALTAHNYPEAIAKSKEAQAAGGEHTAYDNFVIDEFLVQAYVKTDNMQAALPILEALSKSQYSTPDQQRNYARNVTGIYFQNKDCPHTIESAEDLIHRGFGDNQTYLLIAQCQAQTGHYREAAQTVQDVIGKEDQPDEKLLAFQWSMYYKAGDNAAADRTVDRLVTYYPKPDYWQNALAPLLRMDVKDSHLQLNIYRLMYEVGVMHRPEHFGEMAGLALEQGYPGESQAVLERAFASNSFTEPRDKDRYTHMLEGAKQRAAKDKATLPGAENTAKTSDALVQIGAAYLSYGDNEKAVTVISRAIAKGGLKYPDEANILLGVAQLRAQHAAEAIKTFNKEATSSSVAYARLGKLWALHAGSR